MTKLILYSLLLALGGLSWQNFSGNISPPKHFPEWVYPFDKNPLTKAKITLGRVLFYDPILSRDSSISCASCHAPFNAFAHSDHALSHGIEDSIGRRNAAALFNLAWQRQFMWDAAINHLDMQALAPIQHQDEMGESLTKVLEKLTRSKRYQQLFEQAWENQAISIPKMLKALSAFQLSLISAGSKYDKVKLGEAEFNPQEKKGYQLFKLHCNRCHQEPLFSNYQLANNGLAIDSNLMDYGHFEISKNSKDKMLFKVPSLRNLKYTIPYMHDGRFNSLREVLRHYQQAHPYISPSTDSILRKGIPMDDIQTTDLIAFLNSLNDLAFILDPKHRFPKILLQK